MTHTGRMHTPIRPGTARRLGIRAARMPVGILSFPGHLTAEQRTEIERAWLLHRGALPRLELLANADIVGEAHRLAAEIVANPTTIYKIGGRDVTWTEYQAYAADPAPRRRWWQRRNR